MQGSENKRDSRPVAPSEKWEGERPEVGFLSSSPQILPQILGPYDLGLERLVGRVRSTTCQGPLWQADRAIRVRVGSSMGAGKARVRQGREGGLTERDATGRARGWKGPERGGGHSTVCA